MFGQATSVCAGLVMLVMLAGCHHQERLAMVMGPSGSGRHEPVIAGSVEVVAGRAQSMLQGLEIQAVAVPAGDTIRLRCSTKTGSQFTLVLTRAEEAGEERTHVAVEWKGTADHPMEVVILAGLEGMNAARNHH